MGIRLCFQIALQRLRRANPRTNQRHLRPTGFEPTSGSLLASRICYRHGPDRSRRRTWRHRALEQNPDAGALSSPCPLVRAGDVFSGCCPSAHFHVSPRLLQPDFDRRSRGFRTRLLHPVAWCWIDDHLRFLSRSQVRSFPARSPYHRTRHRRGNHGRSGHFPCGFRSGPRAGRRAGAGLPDHPDRLRRNAVRQYIVGAFFRPAFFCCPLLFDLHA